MSTNLDSILMGLFNIYFLFWANFQHSCPTPLSKGGFIYHCPLELPQCEALYWSFLWIGRARGTLWQLHTIPTSTTTMYTLAQLHTTNTRESKAQVGSPGDNCRGVHYCSAYYNCSPLLYLQQISISICFVPRGGWGELGGWAIGPRFAAGVKNSLKIAPMRVAGTANRQVPHFCWF